MKSDQALPLILINGRPTDQLSIHDRSIHYGDGLFETIAIVNGIACQLERHLQRLQTGLQRLAFPILDLKVLQAEIANQASVFQQAVLKLIITRGSGQRGYRPPQQSSPVTVLMFDEYSPLPQSSYADGVDVMFCHTRLSSTPLLAGIKHLNRLEQVLARNEWRQAEIYEGLMLDTDDFVIEATSSNLFVWKNAELLTADLSRCGIDGIMRQLILDVAALLGIVVKQTQISKQDCLDADALLLSNSLTGIVPVRRLENRIYEPTLRPTELISQVMEQAFA
ncbi:MAG: aminodeoxychorismate lyase [Chromatiales bacterium]|jgi:4-amino-4-deoxychorismate lyase